MSSLSKFLTIRSLSFGRFEKTQNLISVIINPLNKLTLVLNSNPKKILILTIITNHIYICNYI